MLDARSALDGANIHADRWLATPHALRPIAVNLALVNARVDLKAALMLSQILYWTRVSPHARAHGGWIFKTKDQWLLETGLSREEQRSALACLQREGLVDAQPAARGAFAYRANLTNIASTLELGAGLNTTSPTASPPGLGRTLAFYRCFVPIAGSVTAAALLSRAQAMQRRLEQRAARSAGGLSPDSGLPWFCLSPAQWQAQTGLTLSQLRTARQALCQRKLLWIALQTHPVRRQFVQVNLAALGAQMGDVLVRDALGAGRRSAPTRSGARGRPTLPTPGLGSAIGLGPRQPPVSAGCLSGVGTPLNHLAQTEKSSSGRRLFAGLGTRAALTTSLKTTTTAETGSTAEPVSLLVWPPGLNEADRRAASRLLASRPSGRHQLLVDEWAARLATGQVRSPLGYLARLVRIDLDTESAGGLVTELGQAVRERREQPAPNPSAHRVVSSPSAPPTQECRDRLALLRAEFAGRAGQARPAPSQLHEEA